jgi:hypothetical protein
MKPCHAAALALVGWYLMVPLTERTILPIAQWNHIASFDTADECERNRVVLAEKNQHDPAKRSLIVQSECIASDDPRLAK